MTWIQANLSTTVSNDGNNSVHFRVPVIKASAALCNTGLCVSAVSASSSSKTVVSEEKALAWDALSLSHTLPPAGFAVQPAPLDSYASTRCFLPFPGEKSNVETCWLSNQIVNPYQSTLTT